MARRPGRRAGTRAASSGPSSRRAGIPRLSRTLAVTAPTRSHDPPMTRPTRQLSARHAAACRLRASGLVVRVADHVGSASSPVSTAAPEDDHGLTSASTRSRAEKRGARPPHGRPGRPRARLQPAACHLDRHVDLHSRRRVGRVGVGHCCKRISRTRAHRPRPVRPAATSRRRPRASGANRELTEHAVIARCARRWRIGTVRWRRRPGQRRCGRAAR
jgi:hypothetical protein